MQLYTTAHVIQVFILGFIGGFFIGGLLVSSIKFKKVTDRRIVIRPIQRKIPSVATTEYPIVSTKNYKVV
ncbi:hypothetical protein [Ruminiclostridium papyrosolvens]|uniref:Uncharacterized protein n=1 Tax=Ruminiclostridium papyrosolvens C7 TaxID=1330534 RepID=U4R1I8_9FIRM|nr:hypothetical protein [Ruminiclostridium papyrosolvens]EPR12041.1 hypothetical protein L323_09810 [Ruminiclostridium papyrosolvens C7]